MIRTPFFLLFVLAGCSAIQQTDSPIQPPQLVKSASLPPIVSRIPEGGMRLNVMILVLEDGTVGNAKFIESSRDPDWDSLALHSIMEWEFLPARREGMPVKLWVRQPLLVQLRDPIVRMLAGLVSATREEADSLSLLLEHGMTFDTLLRQALQVSGERSGTIGPVDISLYAPHLRDELLKLREGEVSRPVRIGNRFIIYKRLKKEPA
jgi:TonB family protein